MKMSCYQKKNCRKMLKFFATLICVIYISKCLIWWFYFSLICFDVKREILLLSAPSLSSLLILMLLVLVLFSIVCSHKEMVFFYLNKWLIIWVFPFYPLTVLYTTTCITFYRAVPAVLLQHRLSGSSIKWNVASNAWSSRFYFCVILKNEISFHLVPTQ